MFRKFLGIFLTIIGAITSVYYLYVVVVTTIAQQKSDYALGVLFIAFFAFIMLLGIIMLALGIYLLKSSK